jgi:hypothetical protein
VSLKQKIENQLSEGKNIEISSADVAGFSSSKPRPKPELDTQDTKTESVDASTRDPLLKSADVELPKSRAEVVVSPEDRQKFLESVVSGKRFSLGFDLLGGAIRVVFRSRSQAESQAVISRIVEERKQGLIVTELDYTLRQQHLMLSAQVEELQGVKYAEWAKPYVVTKSETGTQEPGWLPQALEFVESQQNLIEILWVALKRFEDKYWTMVEAAEDQDFWQAGTSI